MSTTREDMLELSLGLNTKAAVEAIGQYTQSFDRNFKRLERIHKQGNKKLLGSFKTYWAAQKAAADSNEKSNKKMAEASTRLIEVTGKIAAKEQELAAARSANNQQQVKEFEEQLEYLDQLKAKFEDLKEVAEKEIKATKKAVEADFEVKIAGTDVGKNIADQFSAIVSKDAQGFGFAFAKGAGKGLLHLAKKGGGALARKGAAMQEMPGAGGISKALGGLAKGFGSVLNILGRIGPLLGVFGSLAMGLVKIFLDADASFKEFNKTVLATSGQVDYLAGAFGNVGVASADLGKDLRLMYDAALDLENMDFGIDKNVFAEVTSTLSAELGSTQRILAMVRKEASSSADAANQYAKTIQMTVAYARQMGVSYQEMAQLQGQVMRDTGTSFQQMNVTFAQMARATAESGIASNQFFNIIRGVSADLSLYNNRIGDAIKLLGKLGKVMSAKSAEKFMQSISGAMKGMGRVQRLQTTLLAGTDKTREIVQADIASHQKGLAEQVAKATGRSLEEVNKIIAEQGKYGLKKLIKTAPQAQQGALQESASKLGVKKRMAGKGTYGLALAAGETGVAGQADMITAALVKFAGGKSLGEAVGDIGVEQMAENLGISREQVDQLVQFNESMEDSRDELRAGFDKGDPIVVKKLKDLGLNTDDASATQEAIEKLTSQQLMNTMDENEKKALEEAAKVHDYAKETGSFQQSLLDKLDQMLDYFYNWLSKAIMKIIQAFGFFGPGDAEIEQLNVERAAKGDPILGALAAKHKGDPEGLRDALAKTGAGKKYSGALEDVGKLTDLQKTRRTALATEYDTAATPEAKAKAKAEKEKLDGEIAVIQKSYDATKKSLSGVFDKMGAEEGGAYIRKTLGAKQTELEGKKADGTLSDSEDAQLTAIQNVGAEMLAKSFEGKGKDQDFADVLSKTTSEGSDKDNAAFVKALYDTMNASDQIAVQKKAEEYYAQATTPGSIYTHDIHSEAILTDLVKQLTGGPSGVGDPDMQAQTSTLGGLTEEQLETQEATSASLADIYNVLKIKGIRINQSHLDKDVKKVIFEGSREAMEEALFEYALLIGESGAYKALEDSKGKGGSVTGSGLMRGFAKEMVEGNGLANLKAEKEAAVAAAAVAPPSGGGDKSKDVSGEVTVTGKVVLELKNDLDKYMDARIASWSSAFLQRNPGLK